MGIREIFRRARAFDYADLRFLYLACLITIAVVFTIFRVSQNYLGFQRNQALNELRLLEWQRDHVSELKRLIQLAKNPLELQYRADADRLQSVYSEVLLRHQELLEKGASVAGECVTRVCAGVFIRDPFQLSEQELWADLDKPLVAPLAHRDLLNRWYERLLVYHSALRDALDLSIDRIGNRDRVNNLFNWLSYGFLLVLLFLQAFYIFRPAIRRLNASLATRSDFLSRISHEIRNPMNSVLGMADLLKTTRLNYEQQQYLQNLVRSGRTLLEMLNNLIDFSSVENHKIAIKNGPFNLFDSLDRCIDLVSISAHHRNLGVWVRLGPYVVNQLEGDSVRLEQVLINLLNNAVKFTEQGSVTLSVTEMGSTDNRTELEFAVEDTGIGIRHDQIGGIFESFVQADSSIKRRYGGSGLGLSISSELIRLMGGELRVTSTLDQGSRFFFTVKFGRRSAEQPLLEFKQKQYILAAAPSEQPANQKTFAHLGASLTCVSAARHLEGAFESTGERPTQILIDDSLGIIAMINCRNVADQSARGESAIALIRSNFPKENMDLLRRNGFARFLIKPLKPWTLLNQPAAPALEESSRPAPSDWEGKLREKNLRMLLVDDSNDNLFLLKEVVEPFATLVHFAENGLEATEKFRANTYDCVFMDIQMPIMDGYTAIRMIREIEGTSSRQVPVFAVTAHAGLVDAQKCREAGFTDRIVKPIVRRDIYRQLAHSFNIAPPEAEETATVVESALPAKYLEKLIPTYLKTRAEDMEKLHLALDAQDFKAISALGHKMKGSAASYGFQKVSAASLDLERAAASSDHARCKELESSLAQMFNDLKTRQSS